MREYWTPRDDQELMRMRTRMSREDLARHLTQFRGVTVTVDSINQRVKRLRMAGLIAPVAKLGGIVPQGRDPDASANELPVEEDDVEDDVEDEDTLPGIKREQLTGGATFQEIGEPERNKTGDTDPPPPPMPTADRLYIDKPEPIYNLDPLDCGSATSERVLILPDTHAPYHDKHAWALAMKFAREFQPHTLVHLGDWADCFTISDHSKDPRRGSQLSEELAVVRELRQETDDLGAVRKIVTLGNHERRLWRYCAQHAPALLGLMSIEELLEFPQNGWTVIPYLKHGSIGHAHLTHEAGYAGVYAVQHTGNAFASSVVFGHTHRLGCSYFGDLLGKRHVSATLGWLGSLPEADYEHWAKRIRFWQHGVGSMIVEPAGNFHLQLHPFVDGRVRNGQLVEL